MDSLTYQIMMTSKGNPGAVQFCVQAVNKMGAEGFEAIRQAQRYHIVADRLYMLWNDCLNRDTEATCKVILEWPPYKIEQKINYSGGRGLPITKEEIDSQGKMVKITEKMSYPDWSWRDQE